MAAEPDVDVLSAMDTSEAAPSSGAKPPGLVCELCGLTPKDGAELDSS